MVVVGLDVAIFDVVVVLGAVCEIVVPKNQRVILVAVIGYIETVINKFLFSIILIILRAIVQ